MINTILNSTALEDRRSVFNTDHETAVLEDSPLQEAPLLLPQALRIAAKTCGNEVKVISGTERLSYSDIDRYSDALASRLIARHVQPGDRVIVGLPNSAEFMIACFAVWKARAVVVALDHCIRPFNLEDVLERIEPAALIAETAFAGKLPESPGSLPFLRVLLLKANDGTQFIAGGIPIEFLHSALENEPEAGVIPARAEPDDLATITFTSGSTNVPKGVMHTHESILACASFTLSYLQLSKEDVVMLPIPLHHVLAFRRFLTCLLAQCTVVLAPDIFMMRQFSELRPTGLVLVPSGCNILIDNFASFFRKQGECLRYVEIGSEPMSPERLRALQMILPHAQIHLTYGLTEGRVGYLTAGPNGVFDRLQPENYGLHIAVVDSHCCPVRRSETGEILISGSGLFKGYWKDSTEAQAKLRDHGFRTGDMGRLDEDGRIRLMGRIDDMIKVAGHKINPREIEAVLQLHPSVAEAVIIGHSDPGKLGAVLHGFVVRNKGFLVSETELIEHCRERLELYKLPSCIHFRESFPKTPLGKIQRHLVARCAQVPVG